MLTVTRSTRHVRRPVADLAAPPQAGRLQAMGIPLRAAMHSLLPVVCLLGAATAAHAGALWRCVGQQGETVFSSSRADYRDCKRLHPRSVQTVSAIPVAAVAEKKGQALGNNPKAPAVVAQRVAGGTQARPLRRGSPRILRGTVYKVTLADGEVEYTNVRPSGQRARRVDALFTYISACYACNPHSDIDWHTVPLRLHAYAGEIAAAAARYHVDPALLRAVIHAESAFNPYALSDKGAQGLMQLMPGTASEMGVRDVFNPAQNIDGGARYLAQLLRDFGGSVPLAAAAYNAGAGAVRKYDDTVPPYDETLLYVQRVRILASRYQRALARAAPLARNG